MNKQEWDNSLLEHFAPKKGGLSLDLLMEMVAEVMELDNGVTLLSEEKGEQMQRSITLSMIPDIEVSELGWADVRTPDGKGAVYKSREREMLEGYLDNIVGPGGISTLQSKLAQLSSLASNPEQFVNSMQKSGASNGEKIRNVISFLVFYKTLTKIIANFNASSAGFSFEAFLATLLGGTQIPASGADTIADFYDADGEKISLKLYNEKTVEVGGSFDALVGDLVRDGKMTYLVCTKDLRGAREMLNGNLKFYKFDFTLDNVMEILKVSKPASATTILLPFAEDSETVSDIEAPEKVKAVSSEIDEAFKQNLEQALSDLPQGKEITAQITADPHFQYRTDEMQDISSGQGSLQKYISLKKRSKKRELMEQVLRGMPLLQDVEDMMPIMVAISNSLSSVIDNLVQRRGERKATVSSLTPTWSKLKLKKGEKGKQRDAKALSIVEAAEKSAAAYAELRGQPEKQKALLLKTNGYLNDLQFSLNKNEVIELAKGQKGAEDANPIEGVLEIGTSSLQKMLDSCITALNTDIFSVFSDLETLSDSLNRFFAGGLADTEEASSAIRSADSIEGKTAEMTPEK